MAQFRLRTKRFFLTYPQLPRGIDLEQEALAFFERVFKKSRNDFKYLIATELHKDSNPHLHVYLEFNLPEGIYSPNKLDLVFDGRSYHGNYQAVKSPHATWQYIIKSVEDRNNLNTNIDLPFYKDIYYSDFYEHLYAILLEEGKHAAINALYKFYPKHGLRSGALILKNLDLAALHLTLNRQRDKVPEYSFDRYVNLPKELHDWLLEDSKLTLLLSGDPGTGKTELAKALCAHLKLPVIFIRERQGLKNFQTDFHQAIIFDDIDPDEFSREELIHLFDVANSSQIRILYNSIELPPGLVKIITTNRPRNFLLIDKAIARRICAVKISDNIFSNYPTPLSGTGDNNTSTLGDNNPSTIGDNSTSTIDDDDPFRHILEKVDPIEVGVVKSKKRGRPRKNSKKDSQIIKTVRKKK